MTNLHKSTFIAGVCATTLALSACGALDSPRRDRDRDFDGRFYVGGGVLLSQLEPDTDEVDGVSVNETESAGGSLAVGYDLSSRFSVEGHYAALGQAGLAVDGAADEDVDYQVFGLSGLIYGLNDREDRARREGFSLFGRLGVGGMQNESDIAYERVNDVHLVAGIGAEYGFRNGLALRGELVGHDTDARYGQLGLVYRFGDVDRRRARRPAEPASDGTQITPLPVPADEPVRTDLDSDQDGVEDLNDQCLDTAFGSPVDASGCDIFGGVIEGVKFESGSDTLTAGAQLELDQVAQTLSEYQDLDINIDAHTDNTGSAESNLQLSRRRAVSVARYLVGQGVAGDRLKPRAFGESQPRTTNASAEGRAANRRVEFTIAQ